jgi:hypothetical protein
MRVVIVIIIWALGGRRYYSYEGRVAGAMLQAPRLLVQ